MILKTVSGKDPKDEEDAKNVKEESKNQFALSELVFYCYR
jgi:hypothetical protein